MSAPLPGPGPERRLGLAALVLTTLIWGTTFPAMKALSADLSAAQIMVLRYSIAWALLLPFLWSARRNEWGWGMALGALVLVASWLQIEGLMHTSSNRNAFLTGLSVLLVPVIGSLIGHRVHPALWLACALAAAGMAALFWEDAPWNHGDTLTLVGAVFYALYILALGRSHRPWRATPGQAPEPPPRVLPLAAVQIGLLWIAPALSLSAAPLGTALGGGGLDGAWVAWQGAWAWLGQVPPQVWDSVLYLAVVASIGGISLQAWGQRRVAPVPAAVVFGLEPVFAALAAWWLIGERLSPSGWLGAALIVSALMLSQWADRGESDQRT